MNPTRIEDQGEGSSGLNSGYCDVPGHVQTPAQGALRVPLDDLDIDYTETCYERMPFTGVAVETDRNGGLVAETEYRNGLELGWVREYHPDGRLASEYRREVFGPEGPAHEWYPDGRTKSETVYDGGIALSKRSWDEQGEVTEDWHLTEADPDWARLQRRQARQEAAEVTADRASAAPAA